jgi:hypothetical protein
MPGPFAQGPKVHRLHSAGKADVGEEIVNGSWLEGDIGRVCKGSAVVWSMMTLRSWRPSAHTVATSLVVLGVLWCLGQASRFRIDSRSIHTLCLRHSAVKKNRLAGRRHIVI